MIKYVSQKIVRDFSPLTKEVEESLSIDSSKDTYNLSIILLNNGNRADW